MQIIDFLWQKINKAYFYPNFYAKCFLYQAHTWHTNPGNMSSIYDKIWHIEYFKNYKPFFTQNWVYVTYIGTSLTELFNYYLNNIGKVYYWWLFQHVQTDTVWNKKCLKDNTSCVTNRVFVVHVRFMFVLIYFVHFSTQVLDLFVVVVCLFLYFGAFFVCYRVLV